MVEHRGPRGARAKTLAHAVNSALMANRIRKVCQSADRRPYASLAKNQALRPVPSGRNLAQPAARISKFPNANSAPRPALGTKRAMARAAPQTRHRLDSRRL